MNNALIQTIGAAVWLRLERLGPVRATFIGSVLLSLIAISGSIAPNNDGMLYIEAATLYRQGGFEAVRQLFNWMVFSRSLIGILISMVDTATGVGLEASGYLISTLLLSGACALVVACTRDRMPDAGWAACAVVLAVPALNTYRDYIIREFGAWFFVFLAFWLALKWLRQPDWTKALATQVCICLAALFRPESLGLLVALALWQLPAVRHPGGWRRALMMSVLLLVGVAGFCSVLLFGGPESSGKISKIVDILNPLDKFKPFVDNSVRLSDAVLNRWSAENARSILLFGLLSLIPMKFVSNFGLLVIPFIYAFRRERLRVLLERWGPFLWGAAVFCVILSLFVIERSYLAARYVAPLNLLLIPLVAGGLLQLYTRFPRWRWAMAAILLAMSLANVISTSPPKARISDAAAWLKQQKLSEERVYVEMPEIAYLVGWTFTKARRGLPDRDAVAAALVDGQIDLALLDDSTKDRKVEEWAARNRLVIVRTFPDRRHSAVFVVQRSERRGE